MDYEATDRLMSSHVVTARRHGTQLYLTDDGLYSDMLSHARLFRWLDQAEAAAEREQQASNCAFGWEAISYPAAFSRFEYRRSRADMMLGGN